jgi:hypothetical protein
MQPKHSVGKGDQGKNAVQAKCKHLTNNEQHFLSWAKESDEKYTCRSCLGKTREQQKK